VAKTGSSKTLGYLLPGFIVVEPLKHNSSEGPTVLVLCQPGNQQHKFKMKQSSLADLEEYLLLRVALYFLI